MGLWREKAGCLQLIVRAFKTYNNIPIIISQSQTPSKPLTSSRSFPAGDETLVWTLSLPQVIRKEFLPT